MDGENIYFELISKNDDYSQDLRTMFLNIGDRLFKLLEKAEREGKTLEIDEEKLSENWDVFPEDAIRLVSRKKT